MTIRKLFFPWIPLATFHSWITALFYPAVLGTALMGWLQPEKAEQAEQASRVYTHWAPILIAYFALQYGDGIGRHRSYDIRSLLADVAEMLAILAAFDLMNILDVGFMELAPGLDLRMVLPAVFLIPVLNRFSRAIPWGNKPREFEGSLRPRALTILSIAAAVVAGVAPDRPLAAIWVAGVLGAYFLVCLPPRADGVPKPLNAFRRDPPPAP